MELNGGVEIIYCPNNLQSSHISEHTKGVLIM